MSRQRRAHRWVSHWLRCELLDPAAPVGRWPGRGPWGSVTLGWRAADPCVIAMDVRPGPGRKATRWEISRDLLAAGLTGPAGLGDVAIFTDLGNPAYREMVLSSPSGRIGLRLLIDELEAFLSATWRITPAHAEAAVIAATIEKFGRVIT